MKKVDQLNVRIFADGADKTAMLALYAKPFVKGFTTNPTLMRKAGISDYGAFAREILDEVRDRPISFEVFSDDFDEMYRQARLIGSWASQFFQRFSISSPVSRLNGKRKPSGAFGSGS